jgi:hypothetical protein
MICILKTKYSLEREEDAHWFKHWRVPVILINNKWEILHAWFRACLGSSNQGAQFCISIFFLFSFDFCMKKKEDWIAWKSFQRCSMWEKAKREMPALILLFALMWWWSYVFQLTFFFCTCEFSCQSWMEKEPLFFGNRNLVILILCIDRTIIKYKKIEKIS